MVKLRIIHTADSHLGFSRYTKLSPTTNINQREQDTNDAFERVVDRVVAVRPNLFIHAGDLFDKPRPSNQAIAFALEQFRRVSDAKVPTVLIAGNHDTPRMSETAHLFQIFESLPYVHAIYKERLFQDFVTSEIFVSAIPHIVDATKLKAIKSKWRINPHAPVNVAVLHTSLLEIQSAEGGGLGGMRNEMKFSADDLLPEFDYIALGHIHSYGQIMPNAYYAGSTEYFSFNEEGTAKGYIEVSIELDEKNKMISKGIVQVKTPCRVIQTVPDMDLTDTKEDEDPTELILHHITQNCPLSLNKICRMKVKLNQREYDRLKFNQIKSQTKDAIHFEIKYLVIRNDYKEVSSTDTTLKGIKEEWVEFVEKNEVGDDVLELGMLFLS